MSISETDVRHVASLARLEIEDARIDTLVRELNGILVHMDVLQQVEMTSGDVVTPDVAKLAPAGLTSLRADVPGSDPLMRSRGDFAPAERDGFFLVPRLSTHE
jgi:aspartyl-tRNA(Asn)/glutamyl-tRNA(Gln) amidotransferase subunit C